MVLPKFDHDELFRTSIEYPTLAQEFFEAHLPADVKQAIDFSTLKLEKNDFIDPKLRKSICDVLFSVQFNGADGFLFTLLEHQSKPDKWIAFRLLKYMVSIWDRYRIINPKAKQLPPIYPVVFYNGSKPYNVPVDLWNLFTKPGPAKKFFIEGYDLVNLRGSSDEKLLQDGLWLGTLELFMKNSQERNLLELWEKVKGKLPRISNGAYGLDYLQNLLVYTLTRMEENDKVSLDKLIKSTLKKKNKGDIIMATVAQKLWNEGRQEGRQEGRREGIEQTAILMLKQNLDAATISNFTGLSILQIARLKDNLKPKKIPIKMPVGKKNL